MIKNDAGLVAMRYFQLVPQRIKVGGESYYFDVRACVCMCWVKEEHVEEILRIVKTCCGGNKHRSYRFANEMEVRRWTGVSER